LPGLSLGLQFSYLCFPHSWNYRCTPPGPVYLLRLILINCLGYPGTMILLSSLFQVAGITGHYTMPKVSLLYLQLFCSVYTFFLCGTGIWTHAS
jgi:hypothetical protein